VSLTTVLGLLKGAAMANQVAAGRKLKALATNTRVLIGSLILVIDLGVLLFDEGTKRTVPSFPRYLPDGRGGFREPPQPEPPKDESWRFGRAWTDGDDFQKFLVVALGALGGYLVFVGARWTLGMLSHGVKITGRIERLGRVIVNGAIHVHYSYEFEGETYRKKCSAKFRDAREFYPGQEVGVYVNTKRPQDSLLEADFWGESPWR
jgi:hypothetical protein